MPFTMMELVALRNTLNRIEVHGEQNIEYLRSCIQMVKTGIERISAEQNGGDEHGSSNDPEG